MAKDNQKQRLLFVELMAWWEGVITNKAIVRQFGITRQQAAKDLTEYQTLYPNNLKKAELGFQPSDRFVFNQISGAVEEYLYWFTHQAFLPTCLNQEHCTLLQAPARNVSEVVMRQLVAAIRQNLRLEVDYISLAHPENDGRIIHPHTFVKAGNRWHVRGYCEKSQAFRDLVLSRFRGVPELLDGESKNIADDEAWQTKVQVRLQPDPRLSVPQKAVLEQDYQMENGELAIECRASLVSYLLFELQVNTKILDGTPEAQQLVLLNQNDIRPWLIF